MDELDVLGIRINIIPPKSMIEVVDAQSQLQILESLVPYTTLPQFLDTSNPEMQSYFLNVRSEMFTSKFKYDNLFDQIDALKDALR